MESQMALTFTQYRRLSTTEKTFLLIVTREEGFPIAADLMMHLIARHEEREDKFWELLAKEERGPSLRQRLIQLGRIHGLPNLAP